MTPSSASEAGGENVANDDVSVLNNGTSDPVRSSPPPSQDTSKLGRVSLVAQQQQATEIVKALFGDVGKVVGVFSCSVARQSGRLYVSSDGLFFYSNLFGFEKKISIKYDDAVQLIKYRSTSLYVKTAGDEEHVLKSFQDRDSTYKLISGYCSCTQIAENEQSPIHESNNVEARDTSESDKGVDIVAEAKNRSDTASDDSIRSSDSGADHTRNEPPDIDKTAIWEAIKGLSNGWDSSVTNMKLPLGQVSEFFDLFLADGAPNSLNIFHTTIMQDKNVTIDNWLRDDSNESATTSVFRTLRFEHQSKVSVALVTRRQTYRCYGESACLKNVTNISGVPGADTFFVEDFWTLEKCHEEGSITLNVKFRITFSKSTFLKSIIESRSRSEVLEWYSRYTSFVKDSIHGTPKTEAAVESLPSNHISYKPLTVGNEQSTRVWLILCFIVFALYIYHLRMRVTELEKVFSEIQSRMLEVENQCLLGT